MATNLVSLVMKFLTPDMIGRIASALGLDRSKVQAAISAAVPGVLAGFGNVATQSGGAQKLADVARSHLLTLLTPLHWAEIIPPDTRSARPAGTR